MPIITVLFRIKSEPVKENIQRELSWYDTVKQEMQVLRGGKLGFEYREDEYLVTMGEEERNKRGIKSTYRMLPKAEDLEIINYNRVKTISNRKEVERWFDNYSNYNNSSVSIVGYEYDGIEFDVPSNEADDFLYSCERRSFDYRI
ncbi:MAG: hypothetical protein ACTSSP_00925 [Candidatus Asgardarchaeia archaeon]